jgi:hypothetical protein
LLLVGTPLHGASQRHLDRLAELRDGCQVSSCRAGLLARAGRRRCHLFEELRHSCGGAGPKNLSRGPVATARHRWHAGLAGSADDILQRGAAACPALPLVLAFQLAHVRQRL